MCNQLSFWVNMADLKLIKLKSQDEKVFNIPRDVIKMSATVNTLLVDLGLDTEDMTDAHDPIPLHNVHSDVLQKVIDWCTHHKDDTPVRRDNDGPNEQRTDDISAWDAEYFKITQRMIYEIVLAANYLDIAELLSTACKVIANMMKGKSPEEIGVIFNLRGDLDDEEMEHIRRETTLNE